MSDILRSGKTVRGVLAWAVGGTGLLIILGLVLYAQLQRVDTDAVGCPIGRAPASITVLIVDQSDPFERADRDSIGDVVSKWLSQSRQYDRLMVVVPRIVDPYETDIRFDGCAPQNPETANRWLTTQSKLMGPWKAYTELLDKQVERIINERSASATPLIETIVSAVREPVFRKGIARHVVVISDLMEYSPLANFYHSTLSSEQLARAGFLKVPALSGADVELRQVARHRGPKTRPDILQFWRQWLESQGAKVDVETS